MITDLRVGDYIEKSELDTEQKYNDVVSVFEQWGFKTNSSTPAYTAHINKYKCTYFFVSDCCGIDSLPFGDGFDINCTGKKLTYNDVMSLKKDKEIIKANVDAILDPDSKKIDRGECFREDPTIKEISKLSKAVLAMESLGHEWDEEKGQWFRKEYF